MKALNRKNYYFLLRAKFSEDKTVEKIYEPNDVSLKYIKKINNWNHKEKLTSIQ